MKKQLQLLISSFVLMFPTFGQSPIDVVPDNILDPVPNAWKQGVFYVPKTEDAANDFMINEGYQNAIRTHIIESAINNAENLEEAIDLLESIEDILVDLSLKCEKLVFIFEKMPAWLSSSADGSPADTPGWFVLNTKKPENWTDWQNMVTSITEKLTVDFGIENACFEVWNEPDLGSWTENTADYLELYKRTYQGVKAVNPELEVGGPAVNFWANHINWQPVPGFIKNSSADSSLIAEVMEFGLAEGCLPDFISWHHFGSTYQVHEQAKNYIETKCAELDIPLMPIMVSEWNAPSGIRETPWARTLAVKTKQKLQQIDIDYQMIAAWQDFEEGAAAFHHDYGLVNYDGIHKPTYYATLMCSQLKGGRVEVIANETQTVLAASEGDSLSILVANYCPDPFSEALAHTLYNGEYDVLQLDSAGFIDLETFDLTYLESIFNGTEEIENISPMHAAINNAKEIYGLYDSLATHNRVFEINLVSYMDTYYGRATRINEQENNMIFKYDSLQSEGYTRASAASYLRENQKLKSKGVTVSGGVINLELAPNALYLLKLHIDDVGGVDKIGGLKSNFTLYPNPASGELSIKSAVPNQEYVLVDLQGKKKMEVITSTSIHTYSISKLKPGIYFVYPKNTPQAAQKLVVY